MEDSIKMRWISDARHAPKDRPVAKGQEELSAPVKPDVGAVTDSESAPEGGPYVWTQFQVPIEVKDPSGIVAALMQLTTYMRQMLRNCPDRRFVLGLALAKRNIRVYIADPSGVLGSGNHNIDKACTDANICGCSQC